jgi:hypothetical protein
MWSPNEVTSQSGDTYAIDPEVDGKIIWRHRLSSGSAVGGVEFNGYLMRTIF